MLAGSLLSVLYSFLFHGDPSSHGILVNIFLAAYQPFRVSVLDWICQGHVTDPMGEFMVEVDESVTEDNLWYGRYLLSGRRTPSFIDTACAGCILMAGRLVNLLRRCCMDESWSELVALQVEQLCIDPERVTSGSGLCFSPMKQSLVILSQGLSRRAMHLLYSKFDLMTHLAAMKGYILLGQGDFAQALLGAAWTALTEPAENIYKHTMLSYVEQAITTSSVRFAPSATRERIDVHMLDPTRGDVGWDIFSIKYVIDGPLSIVVSSSALEKYQSLFRFVWKLKRVDCALSGAWSDYVSAERLLRVLRVQTGLPPLSFRRMRAADVEHVAGSAGGSLSRERRELLIAAQYPHEAIALRAEMVHFMSNLQYYIGVQVLDCSWATFVRDADAAEDIGSLISAHREYVEAMMRGAMLTDEYRSLRVVVEDLLKSILEFASVTKEYHNRVALEVAVRRLRNEQGIGASVAHAKEDAKSAVAAAGVSKSELSAVDGTVESLADGVQPFIANISELRPVFSKRVRQFIRMLVENKDMEGLFAMSYRLDFSSFYTRPRR